MNADQARAFMRRLAQFAFDHHLKRDDRSPQRGMLYEYLDFPRRGQGDQFVQGEALDTMHDGAWFAAAMVNAARAAPDDPFYWAFLTDYQLPFYCRMLNGSDKLFSPAANHARPGAHAFGKEHMLQPGEKGFVPYWWDDGASVSLERRQKRSPLGEFACVDDFVVRNEPNPRYLLSGYSLGSSNHMAQDLGLMLQQAWLLLRDAPDEPGRKLAAEVAEAARNLQQCRANHGSPNIPMVAGPAALVSNDAKLMQRVPDPNDKRLWDPSNHYTRALYDPRLGQRHSMPGFADDQEYRYRSLLARASGKLTEPMAFALVYDAYTEPMLYRAYSDDADVPPGVNVFDLHPYHVVDGKPADYRSDRKGRLGQPRPVGSRFGPQNMVCTALALQALRAYPGVWERRYADRFKDDVRVPIEDPSPTEELVVVPTRALVPLGPALLELSSTRTHLGVSGSWVPFAPGKPAPLQIALRPRPHAAGGPEAAIVTLDPEARTVTAVNGLTGEPLVVEGGKVQPRGDDNREFAFELRIPYAVVKHQRPWMNGVEHGRYSVGGGKDDRANFYLASSEEQVKAWLEHELAGGLRTWEAVFDELGYVPTGIGTGPQWDHFSDTGGYAHLISAAAQYVLYLEGKNDWDVHAFPTR